ncbi:hypothetical protein NT6N_30460 [Oceaniferula spumae]|uniref:DNA primase/polymerase bifunctional N-terminal domain-containing protein n=1 Tax=Oceaniferula spumae TaxID=2979115 RepID=A0AAT9FPP8_9BACT
MLKKWQSITFDDTQNPDYQRKLDTHGNRGVSLGKISQNLCSIDFDDDDALNQFLELNPFLRDTLRTTAKRGANLWIILTSDYPKSQRLKNISGESIGEWRASGNQTVIQGVHPEGMAYRIAVSASPMLIAFSEIQWGGLGFSSSCHIDDTDGIDHTEIQITQTNNNSRRHTPTLIEKEQLAQSALARLKQDPDLWHLYRTYILHKFTPRQGERNSQLMSMMTFLNCAVSRQRAHDLAKAFYDVNQDVFADSLEQHMREAESHLDATHRRWTQELPNNEQTALAGLPSLQREAYRICRDLAHHENSQCPRGEFFLSCADLARRLGTDMKNAHRILAQLEGMKIITIHRRGTRHSKQSPGKATVYKWQPQTL